MKFIKIGELLLKKGLITEQQLELALEQQKKTKQKIGEVLVELGFISEEKLYEVLAEKKNVPLIKAQDIKDIPQDVLNCISKEIATKYSVLPISISNNILTLAMKDPSDIVAIDLVETITKLKVSPVLMPPKDIEELINKFYLVSKISIEAKVEEKEEEKKEYDVSDAPVVSAVNFLFEEAISRKASDIHIEPLKDKAIARIRIDGRLQKLVDFPKSISPAIASRIKILASLDIAEKRLPQDGKIRLKFKDRDIDMRISTLPTIYGEKVVIRILDKSSVSLNMEDLGFSEKEISVYKEALGKLWGMILCTGPTGSGKTTTLYSGLNYINSPEKNILTVEDPVEYELEGINQVNVKPQIGLTFASALRSFLRQDPDVILVGEIRDKETAEIAIHAALTGHLVLSTLHTNDACSTIARLSYMGIEPFLISSAVDLIIAQRLVRKVCQSCKQEAEVPKSVFDRLGIEVKKNIFYKGKGCSECDNTGYKGRTVVCEMLKLDDEIRQMIIEGASEIDIREKAIKKGMKTLKEAALEKASAGITTIEEALKIIISG
jgi:type IV pilus assembly protein PilB